MYLHVGTVSLSSDLWTYWSLDSNCEQFKLSQQADAVLITAACVTRAQSASHRLCYQQTDVFLHLCPVRSLLLFSYMI